MHKEEGAIEAGALLLLFFLASIISGAILFAMTAMTYTQRNKHEFSEKMDALSILNSIVRDMQALKEYDYDYPDNAILEKLRLSYSEYGLVIFDISSGYHLDFFPDKDITDRFLCEYIFLNADPSNFIHWRNANGLSLSTEKWKEFIKEEAFKSCVCYGWVSTAHLESFAYKTISTLHGTSDIERLFPVVNDFPLMNINMVNPEILKPFIMRTEFALKKPAELFDSLKNKIGAGPVMDSDISSILQIPLSHPIFNYFGTKTSFWKVAFSCPGTGSVEGIIAAIPKRNGKRQEIEEYRLVDRSFIHD
jgi:hypothetical protein